MEDKVADKAVHHLRHVFSPLHIIVRHLFNQSFLADRLGFSGFDQCVDILLVVIAASLDNFYLIVAVIWSLLLITLRHCSLRAGDLSLTIL